ncbi:putative histone tail methylase containing SET domain [Handroanthus impetiginosus]|uniref:Putative histone tail methylase containing SET domain n=1 Tax=Handroanthus impetiginosus TaxID=429701 RepID=A0A2G9HLZ6_9LAMI|nr:putative histone tail methylase containing SET domain [Handroanthus impetiginosus]
MEASVCPIDAQFSGQISTLLSPPPLPQVQEYFEALVTERQCHLKVKTDGKHGKGVYSEVDFQGDDLVLRDQMLVGAQHSSNKIDCLVCSFCFQFIGSIELQIGRKLYLEELGVSAIDECGSSDDMGCSSSSEKTCIPQDSIQSLMNGSLQLPYSENFPLPSVVPCPGGCKEAYYCSKSCAEADWDSFHSLLCIGHGSSSPNTEALSKFIKHANETNDIFILAAKVISFTILRYRKLKAAHVEQEGKHDTSNACDSCIFPLLLEAWKPVSMGFKRRWWECIALPEDVDSCEEAEFRMQIKNLAFESLQLLKEAIYDRECAPLFSLDIYGHIIGMFELNNLDLVVASPVEDYFLYIDDLPVSQKKKAEKITKIFLDALGEDYSISCQGTAFFPLQSCMNHSCIPNAKAFKREEDRDGGATIVALQSIAKGEEITISYIDEDLPYEERQKLLADYGFICRCPKCVDEAS